MKKGISLITLIITIVVIVILAAAVILTLGSNNPINDSKVAELIQSKESMQSGITLYLSKIKVDTVGEYGNVQIFNGNISGNDTKILVDGEVLDTIIENQNLTLYKLNKELFESKVCKYVDTPVNSSWYVDDKGKVYLVFNQSNILPEYMTNNSHILDNKSLISFVASKDSNSILTSGGVAVTTYTISYNLNGGTSANPIMNQYKIENEDIVISKIIPTKSKAEFLGWKDSKGNIYKAGATYFKNEDLNLIAMWDEIAQLEDIIGTLSSGNTVAKDVYGNKIVIPDGFYIAKESTDIVYKYAQENGYEKDIPVVQDGIVITDHIDENGVSDGNEFVWIPVGDIKDGLGQITHIALGRYTFTNAVATPMQTVVLSDKDENKNYEYLVSELTNENSVNIGIDGGKIGKELVSTSNQSIAIAKGTASQEGIKAFLTSTLENGGYYIARYEASKGSDNKAKSVKNQDAWLYITQLDSSKESQSMYQNSNFISDLINGYAWDTAIVFIQNFADSAYSIKNCGTASIIKTGMSGDIVCNIHDLSGNVLEWSTEISSGDTVFARGGLAWQGKAIRCTWQRNSSAASSATLNHVTFRSVIFLNK